MYSKFECIDLPVLSFISHTKVMIYVLKNEYFNFCTLFFALLKNQKFEDIDLRVLFHTLKWPFMYSKFEYLRLEHTWIVYIHAAVGRIG